MHNSKCALLRAMRTALRRNCTARNRSKRVLHTSMLLSSIAINSAYAQQDPRYFLSIPPQRADVAIAELAEQANLTLIFPEDLLQQFSTRGLQGRYSLQQALDAMLDGSRLTARLNDSGALSFEVTAEQAHTPPNTPEPAAPKPTPSIHIEETLVKGIHSSLQRSASIKRRSHGIVDAISQEDIGKFPETNLAESLQRISGVSIDRSGGEGRFVTVRGFGPEFNRVLMNGRQLASDNEGREFSFDLLAAEQISRVVVEKSGRASRAAGGIGSTINIDTAKPFDHDGFRLTASAASNYDRNSHSKQPQFAAMLSQTFANESLGVLISGIQQKRNTRRDQAVIDGWIANTAINSNREASFDRSTDSPSGNIFVPRNYDQRVIFEQRRREGGTLVFQYAPNDTLSTTFDVVYSEFDVRSEATSLGHWFTSADFSNNVDAPIEVDENGTVVSFLQNNGATDFGARNFSRPSSLHMAGLNLDWRPTNNWRLTADASLSISEFADTNGNSNPLVIYGYLARSEFDHRSANTLPQITGFEQADSEWYSEQQRFEREQIALGQALGTVDVSEPAGRGFYLEHEHVRPHVFLRRGSDIEDRISQFQFSSHWQSDNQQGLVALDSGIQFNRQYKNTVFVSNEDNGRHCVVCGYFDRINENGQPTGERLELPESQLTVFDAGTDFLSGVSGAEQIPHQWLRLDQETAIHFIEQQTGTSLAAQATSASFSTQENVTGGFFELHFSGELASLPLDVTTGVRYEYTQVEVNGTRADLEELRVLDFTELAQLYGAGIPVSAKHNYGNLLPSLDLRLRFNPSVVARAAFSRSLTRPTLSQLAPSPAILVTRQGNDFRARVGDPELKPFVSDNIDLSLEWYYDTYSYVSLGLFNKGVSNFIVTTTEQDSFTFTSSQTGEAVRDPSSAAGSDPRNLDAADSVALFDITQPQNSEYADVSGAELALQHRFGGSGFGVMANFTWVSSDADLDRDDLSQNFAITGLSNSKNIIAFYEKYDVQLRIALNQRDAFLQSLSQSQGSGPTFVEAYEQWDISGSYAVNKQLSVYFEGINITNEIPLKHGRYPNHFLMADDTGTRWTFGLRLTF